MKTRGLYLPVLAGAAVVFQLVVSGTGQSFYLTQLTMAVYYAVVVLGLGLLMGYAGQASLGHGAFFAIGGYVSALLTTYHFAVEASGGWVTWLRRVGVMVSRKSLYDDAEFLSVTPWAAFLVAILVAWAVAHLIGYPSLRLRGHYLAVATLGFGLIVYRVVLGSPVLGGADGLTGVPPWHLGFGLTVGGQSEWRVQNYYIACAMALGWLWLLLNLVDSRIGRALRAIHDGETAANAMGVDTARIKLQIFVLSALLAAAAGSFLTHFNGGIGPSESSALKSVRYVALVAAGGMANLWGGLVVSIVLNFLSLRGCFGSYDNAVFGLILILIVSLAPEGPLQPLGSWLRRNFLRSADRREGEHGPA